MGIMLSNRSEKCMVMRWLQLTGVHLGYPARYARGQLAGHVRGARAGLTELQPSLPRRTVSPGMPVLASGCRGWKCCQW